MLLNNTASWISLNDTKPFARWYDIHERGNMNTHIMTISVLNLLFAPFICLSNFSVLVAIWKNARLQTLSNILLANLSITDMFTGLITQLGFAISYILTAQGKTNSIFYWTATYFAFIFSTVSYSTIVYIWTERYFAIFHPYLYLKWAKKGLVIKSLILLWVLCLFSYAIVFRTWVTHWGGSNHHEYHSFGDVFMDFLCTSQDHTCCEKNTTSGDFRFPMQPQHHQSTYL